MKRILFFVVAAIGFSYLAITHYEEKVVSLKKGGADKMLNVFDLNEKFTHGGVVRREGVLVDTKSLIDESLQDTECQNCGGGVKKNPDRLKFSFGN